MTVLLQVSNVPLTHPVTTPTTTGTRRTLAQVEPLREPTICGVPQIFPRSLVRRYL